jgi:arylsulfatase A-like enzyme
MLNRLLGGLFKVLCLGKNRLEKKRLTLYLKVILISFKMKLYYFLPLVMVLYCCKSERTSVNDSRPNILLIVADDLGYSDLSSFGGEISTPNIDQLASQGLSFGRFHTGPMCAVSRAMLLTGNDNHIAGMGSQDLQTDEFGYEGFLTDRVIPLPEILRQVGYFTAMVGKWHLGNKPEHYPNRKGFDQSFVLLEGGANHYSSKGLWKEDPISPYVEDGQKATWMEGDYSTDFYTSKLIQYLDKRVRKEQPFFAFASYTSPHWPLQVDTSYWGKYKGIYDKGYESLKNQRFENLKSLGLLPADAVQPPSHHRVKPWDSLNNQEQMKEARKMEIYAGMVDNLDANVGRLMDYLKEEKQYENTVIIFLSDNGAAGNDFYNHPYFRDFLQANYTDDYEQMGSKESFISYGPQWAEAGAAPFKYFKGYTTQGGINCPMIITGPGVLHQGSMTNVFASIMDIAPTCYEYAKTQYPENLNGSKDYPIKGASMNDLLSMKRETVHQADYVFAIEHREHAMVRKGKWKLLNIEKPFNEDNLQLFDLTTDLAEQVNLRKVEPLVFQDLLSEWRKYREEVKAQFPTPKSTK